MEDWRYETGAALIVSLNNSYQCRKLCWCRASLLRRDR